MGTCSFKSLCPRPWFVYRGSVIAQNLDGVNNNTFPIIFSFNVDVIRHLFKGLSMDSVYSILASLSLTNKPYFNSPSHCFSPYSVSTLSGISPFHLSVPLALSTFLKSCGVEFHSN